MNYAIRLVTENEIDEVMTIINDAKELLKKDSLQWQQGYPFKETMMNDIKRNELYGYYLNDYLVGVVALVVGLDKNYTEIEGKWDIVASEKDLTIHRIAVRKGYYHKKIGDTFIKLSIDLAKKLSIKSIKADTHIKNIPMQMLLINNDFSYKGIIYLKRDEVDNGRLAYELVL
ncbi:GNAT family N-acetyltransferase [bacterium]|nr:GNAT family N-acetyltransferase [bacterium]